MSGLWLHSCNFFHRFTKFHTLLQDVIDAYREKKWNPNTDDFEQCKNERFSDKSSEKLALKEGCQIYGHLEVNRMGGSFHIAPGKSFSLNHIHIHDVHPYSSQTFNTSHTITHLSFGERIHFANTHPLDNTHVYAKEGKHRNLLSFFFCIFIISLQNLKFIWLSYRKVNTEFRFRLPWMFQMCHHLEALLCQRCLSIHVRAGHIWNLNFSFFNKKFWKKLKNVALWDR